MNKHLKTIRTAAIIAGLASATLASAAPIRIDGLDTNPGGAVAGTDSLAKRTSFEGFLVTNSIKTEGFGTQARAAADSLNLTAAGSIGATLRTDPSFDGYDPGYKGAVVNSTDDPANFGRFDTTGDANKQWWLTGMSFSLDFGPAGISAFGFYGTDFGDFRGSFEMELVKVNGDVVTPRLNLSPPAAPAQGQGTVNPSDDVNNGWLQFFAFYDPTDRYSEVRFKITQGTPGDPDAWDYLGFDDFVVGEVAPGNDVPEPGSLALVGASLLALAATRRRRQA